MIDTITKLLLLLSPIVYGVKINLDKFDLRFFEVGVMSLFVASLFDTPKREIGKELKIIILSLLTLVIVNSFWHRFQPLDIRAVEILFFFILGIVLMIRYLSAPEKCIKYIWWALGINIVVIALQKIGYSPLISYAYHGSYIGCEGGMLGNVAKFCIYLAIILPFIPFYFALSLTIIFGLILKYAQLSILLPMLIIIYLRFKRKWERSMLVIPIIAIAVLYHSKILYSISTRWNESWRSTLDMIFQQPFLGWGYGTYYIWTGRESFNSYLPFIYGVGLLGLVWLGFAIREIIKNLDISKESIAIVTLLLLGLIEYPFEIPRLWPTIMFVISIFVIRIINKKEAVNGNNKSNIQRA